MTTHKKTSTGEISSRGLSSYCSVLMAVVPPASFLLLILFFKYVFASLLKVTLSSLPEQQAMTLQQRAVFLLTDNQPSFLDNLIDVYQLKSADVAVLQQHIVRLQSLNLYKEVSVDWKVFFSPGCIRTKSVCFFKAVMLSTKLQCQREVDLEEVRLKRLS